MAEMTQWRRINVLAAATMCVALAVADGAGPTEWFVDVNRETAGDGLTEASALRTIASALNLAESGDIVTVLPGVYGPEEEEGASRVRITKNVHLRSRDGAAVTHIVGMKDSGYEYGIGVNSARCIIVGSSVDNVIVEGFTLRDGSTVYSTGSGMATCGGAVLYNKSSMSSASDAEAVTLRDCIIRDCAAARGGAIYGVTAENCVLYGNICTKFGAAARQCNLHGCLVYGNKGDTQNAGILAYGYRVVNCTIVNNATTAFSNFSNAAYGMTNTICIGRGYIGSIPGATANCIFDLEESPAPNSLLVGSQTEEGLFVAPALGDFRLIDGCRAVTENPALQTSDAVTYCGWSQETVSTNGMSRIDFIAPDSGKGVMRVDGIPVYRDSYANFVSATKVHEITFTPADADDALIGYDYDSDKRRWPDRNGMFRMLPPSSGRHTFAPVTGTIKYVSPEGDDATADGTEEKPYGTLATAVARSSDVLLIAKAGTYASGSARFANHANRVYFAKEKNIRLFAESGPSQTFIIGESDPAPAVPNDYGVGPDAMRCVAIADRTSSVQGFTLTGGRTTVSSTYGDALGVRGGGVCSMDSDGAAASGGVLDCIISNCCASRASAVYGGVTERCLISENHIVTGTQGGVMRNSSSFACVFARNSPTVDSVIGQGASAWNCTLVSNKVASGTAVARSIASTVISNSVFSGNDGYDVGGNSTVGDCVYETAGTVHPGCVKVSTSFADRENMDLRTYATSAGSFMCDAACWRDGMNFTDFNGDQFPVRDDGKITAGAVGALMPAFFAESSVSGGVSPSGLVTEFTDGAAVLTATLPRTLAGFVINGSTQAVEGVSFAVTAAMAQNLAPLTVKAVYAPLGLRVLLK